jgi:hypothetical protein
LFINLNISYFYKKMRRMSPLFHERFIFFYSVTYFLFIYNMFI